MKAAARTRSKVLRKRLRRELQAEQSSRDGPSKPVPVHARVRTHSGARAHMQARKCTLLHTCAHYHSPSRPCHTHRSARLAVIAPFYLRLSFANSKVRAVFGGRARPHELRACEVNAGSSGRSAETGIAQTAHLL
jgi:hypothetical protein